MPTLIAVYQDKSGKARDIALSYAAANGGTKGGVIETNFREETETDLFGEQAVLCGGAVELVKMGFETLTEAGYARNGLLRVPARAQADRRPDVRRRHRQHELLHLQQRGYGEYVTGTEVINEQSRVAMRNALKRIQTGEYAKMFILEGKTNYPSMTARRRLNAAHPIEVVGEQLRDMMPWIKANKLVDQSKN